MSREIEICELRPGETPGEADYILVLHALSGDYRIVASLAGHSEIYGRSHPPSAQGKAPDTQETAIAQARVMARERGLVRIYLQESP